MKNFQFLRYRELITLSNELITTVHEFSQANYGLWTMELITITVHETVPHLLAMNRIKTYQARNNSSKLLKLSLLMNLHECS